MDISVNLIAAEAHAAVNRVTVCQFRYQGQHLSVLRRTNQWHVCPLLLLDGACVEGMHPQEWQAIVLSSVPCLDPPPHPIEYLLHLARGVLV